MGKKKVSAFIIFVNEQKDLVPEWRNKSMPELVQLCQPHWEELSPEERQIYEGRKRQLDATGGQSTQQQRKTGEVRSGGYDTHGRPLEDIKKRDEEMKEAELEKMETIHKMVAEAVSGKKLENKEFFMIEVNTFCEDVPALAEENLPPHKQTKKETVPAEISICKYTLEKGVTKIKHYFVKPGKFSRGFSFIVKDNIQKTHKIDSVQEDDFYLDYRPHLETSAAEIHYESIVNDILTFLDPSMKDDDNLGRDSRIKQILFTMPGSVARCEMSLLWLYKKIFGNSLEIEDVPMRILELPNLFHELAYAGVSEQLFKATTAEEEKQIKMKVITTTIAEHFLEKDTFKFADGMSCDWHKINDEATDGCGGSDHCSSTAVRRWGFIMSDNLCQKFGIDLIKGRHIPQESDDSPPDDTAADQEWDTLPGLAIRPPVASKGRCSNTDIRYRDEENMPGIQMGLPNADRMLRSTNTISDFLDDGSSASQVTDFGDAKSSISVEGKETERQAASKERMFGYKNALMAGLLANKNNGHAHPPTGR